MQLQSWLRSDRFPSLPPLSALRLEVAVPVVDVLLLPPLSRDARCGGRVATVATTVRSSIPIVAFAHLRLPCMPVLLMRSANSKTRRIEYVSVVKACLVTCFMRSIRTPCHPPYTTGMCMCTAYSIIQHYSVLYCIIKHYTASYSILQHYSAHTCNCSLGSDLIDSHRCLP